METGTLIVLNSITLNYEKQKDGRRPNIIYLLTDQDEEKLLDCNKDKIKWIKIIKEVDNKQYFIREITDITRLNLPRDNGIIFSWRHHE